MRYYLELGVVTTDYFSESVTKNVYNEQVYIFFIDSTSMHFLIDHYMNFSMKEVNMFLLFEAFGLNGSKMTVVTAIVM